MDLQLIFLELYAPQFQNLRKYQMTSLRQECKQRFKVAFDSVRVVSNTLNFILVVDQYGLKVLSNTIKMMELINYGITIVEKLELKRKRYSKIEAVYLIHPRSLDKLIEDYPEDGKPQYKSVHILTLSKISAPLMNKLSQATNLVRRIKTLKEINFSFSLHSHNEVKLCSYQQDSFQRSLEGGPAFVESTIEELSSVLTSLSAFYVVQIYYQKSITSSAPEKIALGLKEKFEQLFKSYNEHSVPNYSNSAPLTTFLILDRSIDPVSPLVRDFHYGPLFYDLKNIKNHKVTDFGKDKKILSLNENDQILDKYKNSHISLALKGIPKDFQDFSQNHAAAKFHKNEGNAELDVNKLAEVMKKMPQYMDIKDRYTLHYEALEQILSKMEDMNLKEQGFLQQSILSLTNEDGKKIKEKDAFESLIKIIPTTEDQREIAKLVLLGLMCLELKEKDQTLLTKFLSKTRFEGIEKNISKLAGPNAYRLNPKKEHRGNEILDKHQTKIEEIVRDISNQNHGDLKLLRVGAVDKYSKSATKNAPSLGLKKIRVENDKKDRPRLIVFFNSAIGYNQIRALSEFESMYQIIYASHNFVTPNQYLDLINKVGVEQEQLQL